MQRLTATDAIAANRFSKIRNTHKIRNKHTPTLARPLSHTIVIDSTQAGMAEPGLGPVPAARMSPSESPVGVTVTRRGSGAAAALLQLQVGLGA